MNRRSIVATILQASGILSVAAGIGFFSLRDGLIALGVGTLAFGIAVERDAH